MKIQLFVFIILSMCAQAFAATFVSVDPCGGQPCELYSHKALITFYSAPSESDFGSPESSGTESVCYVGLDEKKHCSDFVKGFASRFSQDPLNDNFSGVGMEGAGYIVPEFHRDDPALQEAFQKGYHVLVLQNWDEATQTATFELSQSPMGSKSPLTLSKSAAIKSDNKLIHEGDCLAIVSQKGDFLGYRLIDDNCSSCVKDDHVDLFESMSFSRSEETEATIFKVAQALCTR